MSLLTVRHVTTYRYADPVGLGEHRMMFRPRESHDLRLIEARLDIVPQPTQLRWVHDVFDNSVAVATFSGTNDGASLRQHRHAWSISRPSCPTTRSSPRRRPILSPIRATICRTSLWRCSGNAPAADIDRWAASFLASCGSIDTLALLRAMTVGMREQLAYARRTERGVQTPSETLQRGSGSCRDFALAHDRWRAVARPRRPLRQRLYLRAGCRAVRHARRRRDPCLAAGVSAGRGMGRFRSDQPHHRQPQSHSRRGGLGSGAGLAALGQLHRNASSFLGMEVAVSVVNGTRPTQGRSNGRKRPRTSSAT